MNDNKISNVTKPTWAQIQTAINWASHNRAQQEIAWNEYQKAKEALTNSPAYQLMESTQKEWSKRLSSQHDADKDRDAILRLALGIEEEVTPTE